MAAIGARAAWITGEHPDDDGYGPRSPFARLVEADGQVLMLGAPLDTVTLLHHAEADGAGPEPKRTVDLPGDARRGRRAPGASAPTRTSTRRTARSPTRTLGLEEDEFAVVARAALAAGIGEARSRSGRRRAHLFPAPALTAFAVAWMEERFA